MLGQDSVPFKNGYVISPQQTAGQQRDDTGRRK